MKRVLLLSLLTVVLLAACGPAPTPPPPTADVAATSKSITGTIVAGTLTAMPTATLPPTDTPTPAATDTPPATDTATSTASPTITATSLPFEGTLAPAGVGQSKTSLFRINNETSDYLNITMYGVSANGNLPVYYQYGPIKYSFNFTLIWGTYNWTVQIGNKKTFSGKVRIYNYDKTTMNVKSNGVVISGP